MGIDIIHTDCTRNPNVFLNEIGRTLKNITVHWELRAVSFLL